MHKIPKTPNFLSILEIDDFFESDIIICMIKFSIIVYLCSLNFILIKMLK